tara:strand:- start:578 stop:682 length:105 start_codon:yes stop_codon:yes gene_type:complete
MLMAIPIGHIIKNPKTKLYIIKPLFCVVNISNYT